MSATTAAPSQPLELNESITLALEEGATFDSQGAVPIHIIRPGVGKGRGRHLYEASMLAQNAEKFSGWRMYVDHLSPEARKAAGGLPRGVRDLGGIIKEARWDPTVPADPERGYGQGAVVGRAVPVPYIRELIETDPELLEASISASATGVRQVMHDGQRVWLVEGINDRGSVDWVTEAGAGGRVAPLLEAAYDTEEAVEMALVESMTDEEFAEYVHDRRPGVSLVEAPAPDDGDPEDAEPDEDDAQISRLVKKGMSPAAAKKFVANRTAQEASDKSEEDDMAVPTTEQLQEALASSPTLLVEALMASGEAQEFFNGLVEAKLEEERTLASAVGKAERDRDWELRDMQDEARKIIAESKLPERWQDGLAKRFRLAEDRAPTAELDLVDDLDEQGEVTKPAMTKLRESVEAAISEERERLAEVAPTRVRGQGPAQAPEGEEGEKRPPKEKPFYAQFLSEAGVDVEKAYPLS